MAKLYLLQADSISDTYIKAMSPMIAKQVYIDQHNDEYREKLVNDSTFKVTEIANLEQLMKLLPNEFCVNANIAF